MKEASILKELMFDVYRINCVKERSLCEVNIRSYLSWWRSSLILCMFCEISNITLGIMSEWNCWWRFRQLMPSAIAIPRLPVPLSGAMMDSRIKLKVPPCLSLTVITVHSLVTINSRNKNNVHFFHIKKFLLSKVSSSMAREIHNNELSFTVDKLC